mgnify:CR=1 FL=1
MEDWLTLIKNTYRVTGGLLPNGRSKLEYIGEAVFKYDIEDKEYLEELTKASLCICEWVNTNPCNPIGDSKYLTQRNKDFIFNSHFFYYKIDVWEGRLDLHQGWCNYEPIVLEGSWVDQHCEWFGNIEIETTQEWGRFIEALLLFAEGLYED